LSCGTLRRPELHTLVQPVLGTIKMPHPHAAQRLDDRQQCHNSCRYIWPGHRIEKAKAVCANLDGISIALGSGLRQTRGLDPPTVTFMPVLRRQRMQQSGAATAMALRAARTFCAALNPTRPPKRLAIPRGPWSCRFARKSRAAGPI
jgi:hypothetical protein